MKQNMGLTDKVIRIVVAILFIVLYMTNVIAGIPGIVLLALAGIFILTSLLGFCPLYLPLRINTGKKK
jgi:hypothetical protein